MKKIILVDRRTFLNLVKLALVMSFLFMEGVFCAQSLATDKPTPEEIRKEFIEKGKLPQSAKVKAVKNPYGRSAEQIIIFKSNKCIASVAKVFKHLDAYLSENKKITKMQGTLELINEQHKCNNNLPIISSRKGNIEIKGVGIILFEKAKGKTLDEAYFFKLSSIADDNIKLIFTSIGKQFGTLDKFMYEGQKKVLIQGDSRGANFMYDEKNHQLYWIDLDELALKDDASGITELSFLDKLLSRDLFDKLKKFGHNSIAWELAISDVPDEKEEALDQITQLEGYIPYLKYIPAKKLSKLRAEFAKLIVKMHKKFLTVKSFGEGYVLAYPEGKKAYNMWIEKKNYYNLFNKEFKGFNELEKALGLPETHFIDLKIQ